MARSPSFHLATPPRGAPPVAPSPGGGSRRSWGGQAYPGALDDDDGSLAGAGGGDPGRRQGRSRSFHGSSPGPPTPRPPGPGPSARELPERITEEPHVVEDAPGAPGVPSLGELAGKIAAAASDVLGQKVEPDSALADVGADSVSAVEIRSRLAELFGLAGLPETLLFDYPTVSDLAQHVRGELAAAAPAARPGPGAPASRRLFGRGDPGAPVHAPGPGPPVAAGPTEESVAATVRRVLRDVTGAEIDAGEALASAGVDSLQAGEVVRELNRAFPGADLAETLVFDYPSARDIARHLLEVRGAWLPQPAPAPAGPAGGHPGFRGPIAPKIPRSPSSSRLSRGPSMHRDPSLRSASAREAGGPERRGGVRGASAGEGVGVGHPGRPAGGAGPPQPMLMLVPVWVPERGEHLYSLMHVDASMVAADGGGGAVPGGGWAGGAVHRTPRGGSLSGSLWRSPSRGAAELGGAPVPALQGRSASVLVRSPRSSSARGSEHGSGAGDVFAAGGRWSPGPGGLPRSTSFSARPGPSMRRAGSLPRAAPDGPRTAASLPPARGKLDRGEVERLVIQTIKEASGVALSPGDSLLDNGVDSLSAVEVRNRLQERLGVEVPETLAFDFPTPGEIAGYVCGCV